MKLKFWDGQIFEILGGYVPVNIVPVGDFVGGDVEGQVDFGAWGCVV